MAASVSREQTLDLARTLPRRLRTFFLKHPPPPNAGPNWGRPTSPFLSSNTRASSPHVSASVISTADSDAVLTSTTPEDVVAKAQSQEATPHNPFLPRKNFTNGKWYGPRYGLRQQADLVKLASQFGVLSLLPYTKKLPGEKEKRRIEQGLRVRGTGVGQKVKGHQWERTLEGKLERRRQAMLDMPRLITEWKSKGHGRGWKKWPSGKRQKK